MIDLLIIKPGAQKKLYQDLSKSISGLEPPLWAALLAAFIRESGFSVRILDAEIEPEKLVSEISENHPGLIAIVVSGTNPSASTMNMPGARAILEKIKSIDGSIATVLIGMHPSALPKRTLDEEPVRMVCEGEGFFTVLDILSDKQPKDVRGLWYRENNRILSNARAQLVDPDNLLIPAWDLLPMNKYRAHNWHCFGRLDQRVPYGVIYTSLGCPFNCSFCCINTIFGKHTIRYRSPENVIADIDFLVKNYRIKNIKIIDEMFDLNEKHVVEICDLIIQRKYGLNIWAYARVDTINETKLKKMKAAGINWLGIGFESANKNVRGGVSKGRFNNEDMKEVAKKVHAAGVYIGGNFMFGLPDDNLETMQETLILAKELNCEYTNFYVTMAYPGSELYQQLKTNSSSLPDSWFGYSQFGYDTQPLPTKYLTSAEVIKFRDNAFNEFYSSPRYQDMVLEKFGEGTLQHIKDMSKYKLKRRLLGD